MNNIDPNMILIVLGLIAIIIELLLGAVTGFDMLILGIAFILGGGFGILTHSFPLALLLIVILSFLYVFFGRRMLKKELAIKTTKTNVDSLISMKGIVLKEITPDKPGQIKVEGEIWRAESKGTVTIGKSVIIDSVSGVTLLVHPEQKAKDSL